MEGYHNGKWYHYIQIQAHHGPHVIGASAFYRSDKHPLTISGLNEFREDQAQKISKAGMLISPENINILNVTPLPLEVAMDRWPKDFGLSGSRKNVPPGALRLYRLPDGTERLADGRTSEWIDEPYGPVPDNAVLVRGGPSLVDWSPTQETLPKETI